MAVGSLSYVYGPGGGGPLATPRPRFTGTAPTPTHYADFVAPDPNATSKAMAFRAAEGQKAIQHSAAAHGTLLSGGLLKSLENYRQGLASEEYGNDFNRALQAYTANRDTNAQNFGQDMSAFSGGLNAFGMADRSALDWAQFDRAGAPTMAAPYAQTGLSYGPAPGDDYAAQVASTAAQNAAESDRIRRPMSLGYFPRTDTQMRGGVGR